MVTHLTILFGASMYLSLFFQSLCYEIMDHCFPSLITTALILFRGRMNNKNRIMCMKA